MEHSAETGSQVAAAIRKPAKSRWIGPLLLVMCRSAVLPASQALVALGLVLRGDPAPWNTAGRFWTIYGTIADAVCLALLWKFTRADGTTIRSLIGKIRLRYARDLWLGLGLCVLIFPLFVVGGMLANLLVYGSISGGVHPTIAVHHAYPLWGMIYSLGIWWIIWTPTEQITYQGYALEKIRALSGRNWVALVVVGFWWTLQHSFLPFVLDWRVFVVRSLMVVPGLTVMMLVYLRTRRLAPVIVAQWPMDIMVAWMTTHS